MGSYPVLGGGYRIHSGPHALDMCCKGVPWAQMPTGQIGGRYLHYPQQNGVYFGGGGGFVRNKRIWKYGSPSLDSIIGYQWKIPSGRKLHLQLEGITPLRKHKKFPIWPALSIGVSF